MEIDSVCSLHFLHFSRFRCPFQFWTSLMAITSSYLEYALWYYFNFIMSPRSHPFRCLRRGWTKMLCGCLTDCWWPRYVDCLGANSLFKVTNLRRHRPPTARANHQVCSARGCCRIPLTLQAATQSWAFVPVSSGHYAAPFQPARVGAFSPYCFVKEMDHKLTF